MKCKEYETKTGKPIRLYNGDCMELMEGKPENYWDLAIVDPPYGIDAGNMTMGSGEHKFKNGDWDKNIPQVNYFIKLFDKTYNQIVWGGNYFTKMLPDSPHWIVWDKMNPNLSFSEAELAWVKDGNRIRIFSHYSAKMNGASKIHPTEKPIRLYRWLLQNYATEGDTILDTHGGSFSLAIACYIEDFELDIIELDEDYYNDAVKRFEQHISQKTLF